MKNKIYKYHLQLLDQQVVVMPIGAKILTAQIQNGDIMIWAVVDTEQKWANHYFRIIGTGNDLPVDCTHLNGALRGYIGTVQLHGFVWHIFEV